ncbi:zona pellucida sperm-binding protein 3-like [Aulostomus maculatus]
MKAWPSTQAIGCYTYQTQPLFLSFSELAALEANARPGDHEEMSTAAGDHKVKTFAVKCDEDGVEVVMKAYLFDPDLPVDPSHLRLGPGRASQTRCTASESEAGEFIIRAPLSDCGGQVVATGGAVRYTNVLLYSAPGEAGGSGQPGGAAVTVSCEYNRKFPVGSKALKPTWSPLISVLSNRLHLDFQLRLMTGDWSGERPSSVYFLGDVINMEASVQNRLPLRLYVNSCVASLTSDLNSYPRYAFIDPQGCFIDSQLNGSSSGFLPRVHNSVLRIQLEPFLFHLHPQRAIYITCHLEAEPTSNQGKTGKKACSFNGVRWTSVDGDDGACESCSKAQETEAESGHKRAPRSNTGLDGTPS